jgi:hypothetical protein
MAKSPQEQLAMIMAAAQPHCDEPLETAMICSRPGAMGAAMLSAIGTEDYSARGNDMPPTTILAVGPSTVYAFKYKPKGFKVKLKGGSEVARWPRDQLTVEVGEPGKVTSQFALVTQEGATYPFEVTTVMSGKETYELFLATLLKR